MVHPAVLGYAPDRAIRARATALFVDGLLLGILTRLIAPAAGVSSFGGAVLLTAVVQFVYFFAQESTSGATVGKRIAGLQVVKLDGSPPTLQEYAIRNGIRFFDALPMFYASGLVSVMWSGPGLRQRMGDRVAGTTVIRTPGGKALTTPGWLLPALTVSAVLLSLVFYGVVYDQVRSPNVDANALYPPTVPGFSGDNSAAPMAGPFNAQAILNGQAAIDLATGQPLVRSWQIDQSCSGGSCSYTLSRDTPGVGREAGALSPQPDGWHVVFPTRAFRVACPGSSALHDVLRRAAMVLHFDPAAHTAEAHEVTLLESTDCGSFQQALDWDASPAHF